MDLKEYIFNKVEPIIRKWDEEGIYAVSFFVHENMSNNSIPTFSISYNTEADCDDTSVLSEERWNYAFWRQDEIEVIGDEASTATLLQWYKDNGIENIGFEDEDTMYDDEGEYIGKGPTGYYELAQVVSAVAKELHEQQVISNTFKKELPIIIHDLEYSWFMIELTKEANPSGEADTFLAFCEENF